MDTEAERGDDTRWGGSDEYNQGRVEHHGWAQ